MARFKQSSGRDVEIFLTVTSLLSPFFFELGCRNIQFALFLFYYNCIVLYIIACIVLVFIFGFYVVLTIAAFNTYGCFYIIFYSRFIHIVMRISSNYILTGAIEVMNYYNKSSCVKTEFTQRFKPHANNFGKASLLCKRNETKQNSGNNYRILGHKLTHRNLASIFFINCYNYLAKKLICDQCKH